MDVTGFLIVPVKWDAPSRRWVEGSQPRFVRRFPPESAHGHQVVFELVLHIEDEGIDPPVIEATIPAGALTVQAQLADHDEETTG